MIRNAAYQPKLKWQAHDSENWIFMHHINCTQSQIDNLRKVNKRIYIYRLTFVICSDEAKNVLVTQHDRLVYFGFAEPRGLFAGGEYFNSDILATPPASPNLTEATFTNYVH